MDFLRKTLAILLDPTKALAKRYDEAVGRIKGFGKALATAILLVTYPQEYGVWNNTSEAALKRRGIWPDFERGSSPGQRYEKINQLLNQLANDLGVELWTLDALMWGAIPEADPREPSFEPISPITSEHRFGLERHLHDFLLDNWDQTSLGKDWEIYSEPGEDEAGYEYPTDIGRIDLLTHHRSKNEWLVIELKREKSSDATVGQLLRYMGWVKHHLAEKGEIVKGMIISRDVEDSLRYAISVLDGIEISLQSYEVEFRLKPVKMDF
jgi:hypothetical protein